MEFLKLARSSHSENCQRAVDVVLKIRIVTERALAFADQIAHVAATVEEAARGSEPLQSFPDLTECPPHDTSKSRPERCRDADSTP